MNSELEAYFAAARNAGVESREDTQVLHKKQVELPKRFLEKADSLLKPVMDATAETLQRHGYGATVELVRDQSGSDPNTFPFIILHFSAERCPPADLGYIFTLAGASISFICRRNELCVEVVAAHPAGRGHERRVNFSTLDLGELNRERVSGIVTDAVKRIIRL
jgi:hypothetical protein